MHVEIDNRDALRPVLGARIKPGDGRVGEQAKPHGVIGLGVVAGRTHLAERVGGAPRHDRVDRVQAGADRAQRRLPCARRHDRIAVDVARAVGGAGRDVAHVLQVRDRMREQDVLLHVLAQRRLLAREAFEHVVPQHLVDGAHAIGALGVSGPRIVLDEARMRDEKRGHGERCALLGSVSAPMLARFPKRTSPRPSTPSPHS